MHRPQSTVDSSVQQTKPQQQQRENIVTTKIEIPIESSDSITQSTNKNVPSSTSSDMCSNSHTELLKSSSDPKRASPVSVDDYLNNHLNDQVCVKRDNTCEKTDVIDAKSIIVVTSEVSDTRTDEIRDNIHEIFTSSSSRSSSGNTRVDSIIVPRTITAIINDSPNICDNKLSQCVSATQSNESTVKDDCEKSARHDSKINDANVDATLTNHEDTKDEKISDTLEIRRDDDTANGRNNNEIRTTDNHADVTIVKTDKSRILSKCDVSSCSEIESITAQVKSENVEIKAQVKTEEESAILDKIDKFEQVTSSQEKSRDVFKRERTTKVIVNETTSSELIESDGAVVEDPQPIRITPPLYTYSNPVVLQRDDTPSPAEQNPEVESSEADHAKRKRRRKQELEDRQDVICIEDNEEATSQHFVERLTPNSTEDYVKRAPKSLLEQLLIEIPNESNEKRSLRTRSQKQLNSPDVVKTPKSSPHGVTAVTATSATTKGLDERRSISPYAKASPKLGIPKLSPNAPLVKAGKRKRQGSESSIASSTADDNQTRPGKRKCSENAAELIKACMGVEESGPIKKKLPRKDDMSKKSFNILDKANKGVYSFTLYC